MRPQSSFSQLPLSPFAILMVFLGPAVRQNSTPFHLTLGVLCSLIIAFLSHDLLFANIRIGRYQGSSSSGFLGLCSLACFIRSSCPIFHVAYLALSPKMPIDPQIIRLPDKAWRAIFSWVAFAKLHHVDARQPLLFDIYRQ